MIVLAMWYERELVKAAINPILTAIVCLVFSILFILLAIVELSLVLIAPAALFLGYESREWNLDLLARFTKGAARGSEKTL